MKTITTILALAVLALPSCRHGRTGPQGEPGQNGIGQNGADGQDGVDGQDGTPADRIVVLRGIDGANLPNYVDVLDALPADLEILGDLADEEGLLIVTEAATYAVRSRDELLVVLRASEDGELPGGEIRNSPGSLRLGDIVIFTGRGPKSEK